MPRKRFAEGDVGGAKVTRSDRPCAMPDCRNHALAGFRYCFGCLHSTRNRMEREGYLTPDPVYRRHQPGRKLPRYADEDGASDGAVRALEGD